MAIDYYQQGHDASDKEIKLQLLRRASEFVKDDLKFGGFDQIFPSTVLNRKIEEERQNLGGQ